MQKKKIPNKEPSKKVEEKKKESNKEFYWVLGVMAGLIVVFLIAFSTLQSFKSFEYEGLKFSKEKFGEIPLYKYYYSIPKSITSAVVSEPEIVNLYLRIDPRKNMVPVIGDRIRFYKKLITYVSIDSEGLLECEKSTIAVASLGTFLSANQLTVEAGVPGNNSGGNQEAITELTCSKFPANPMIIIQAGEETSIVNDKLCYKITVANCEILEATEKFMVQTILDARAAGEELKKSIAEAETAEQESNELGEIGQEELAEPETMQEAI